MQNTKSKVNLTTNIKQVSIQQSLKITYRYRFKIQQINKTDEN